MSVPIWFLGTKASAALAAALGAGLTLVPEVTFDSRWSEGARLERWRADAGAGPPVDSVVVAVWDDPAEPVPLAELGPDRWLATTETPIARWFVALAVAAERCAPGGQVVAVVDRPNPRESSSRGGPAAVADAVEVLTRSLAEVHGHRRVRVNVVTDPTRMGAPAGSAGNETDHRGVPETVGRAGDDLVAAVAMLLSGESAGVTANTVRIGGSR